MPRRPEIRDPEEIRNKLGQLINEFESHLEKSGLREKVLALIPAFHLLRDLGSSLMPVQDAVAARARILTYFKEYPRVAIHGDEIMVISGIQDWPRRIRELRREYGWSIASGVTIQEMVKEGEVVLDEHSNKELRPEEYILLQEEQDRDAAHRWKTANDIRKMSTGVKNKILEFLRANIGYVVSGEELRYVAKEKSEWARRVRELRTEDGWPIATRNTGRPDLPVGSYVLEQDRQSPAHDRYIPDPVRRSVLLRDAYSCCECGWNHAQWNPSDPRHLELHHLKAHVEGGENTEENLIVLCTVCHDEIHRKS